MHNRLNALLILRKAENSRETIECSSLTLVHWFPPFLDWIKINTDEATNGSPGLGSFLWLYFRISKRFWEGCSTILIGIAFAFEAELIGVVNAIFFASQLYSWNRFMDWNLTDPRNVVVPQKYNARMPFSFFRKYNARMVGVHQI